MTLSEEQIQFIGEHRTDDVRRLALRGVDPLVLRQIDGWQRARTKLPEIAADPHWIYPVHLSMEQCSGEITARYKAEIMAALLPQERRGKLVDLTGGFGIDCLYVGRLFREVHYVERNEELCEIARHNMPHVQVHHTDSVEFLRTMPRVDAILIDPARRDGCGRKVAGLSDCTPDLTEIHGLLCEKADHVLVKLSPMLDIREALRELPEAREVHVVSVNGECKEILLSLSPKGEREVRVVCVNIPQDEPFEYTWREGDKQKMENVQRTEACQPAACAEGQEMRYLYEPNASIMKAGCFREVAEQFGIRQLAENSHLYGAENPIEGFPGRGFIVRAVMSLKDAAVALKGTQANVATRNFPLKAEELKKKLRVRDGGDTYVFGTTLANGSKVVMITIKNP